MTSPFLRRGAFARALVLAVLVVGAVLALAPSVLASGSSPTALGRTGWQVTRPYSPVSTLPFTAPLGNAGFYNYIPGPIPDASSGGWSDCGPANALCKSADTIDMYMPDGSRLGGYVCGGSADFTFFQSLVSIPAGTQITQFSVNMSGADDGARVSIYNSAYPSGFIFPGSYIQLTGGTGSTTDLSPYMVAGEVNRVLITQMDNCAVGNNLQYAEISLNGTVVPSDTTPPAASPVVSPAANGVGWNNSDVTVNWNWSDGGSGIDSSDCTQTSTSSGEGAITLTATCQDLAGNSASDSVTVNVDKSAPTITGGASPAPNTAGWNNTPVTVAFTCADNAGGSGIATDTVGGTTLITDGANQSVTSTGDCVDLAGNAAAPATVAGISIDQTPPTLAPTVSPNPLALNASATASPNASDALSGIASASCGPVDTSKYGDFTVSCTATDKAGNTATRTTSYEVAVEATKQQVLSEIQAAMGSAPRERQELLRVAAGALQRAIQPRLWTDGNHPTTRIVFADEQLATDTLSAFEHERRTSVPDATVQGWISSLVTADQGLASIAIADATAGAGNAKAVALASKELAKGDSEAAHGRANAAIAHYADAWQMATQSGAKHVENHDGDGKGGHR